MRPLLCHLWCLLRSTAFYSSPAQTLWRRLCNLSYHNTWLWHFCCLCNIFQSKAEMKKHKGIDVLRHRCTKKHKGGTSNEFLSVSIFAPQGRKFLLERNWDVASLLSLLCPLSKLSSSFVSTSVLYLIGFGTNCQRSLDYTNLTNDTEKNTHPL